MVLDRQFMVLPSGDALLLVLHLKFDICQSVFSMHANDLLSHDFVVSPIEEKEDERQTRYEDIHSHVSNLLDYATSYLTCILSTHIPYT